MLPLPFGVMILPLGGLAFCFAAYCGARALSPYSKVDICTLVLYQCMLGKAGQGTLA